MSTHLGIPSVLGLCLALLALGCGDSDLPRDTGHEGPRTGAGEPARAARATPPEDASRTDPPAAALDSADHSAIDPREIEALKKEELDTAAGLLARFPKDAETLGLLAVVHRGQGHAAKAAEYWEACLRLDPDLADVHDGMGTVASRQGNTEEAIEHWQRARSLRPDLPGLTHRLARALIDVGRTEEAVRLLQAAGGGADPAVHQVLLGDAYLQERRFDEARAAFAAALALRPDAHAHYGLGLVAAKTGDPEAARRHMQEFQRLKEAGRESQVAHAEDVDEGRQARERAARVQTLAGRICAARGLGSEAAGHWRRAAQLDSRNWTCRLELARGFVEGDSARAADPASGGGLTRAEAERWADELWTLQPTELEPWVVLGDLYLRWKRAEDSVQAYRRALQRLPGDPRLARACSAALLETATGAPEARALLLESLEREPHPGGYHLLARAFQRMGDRPAALAAARRATELDPGNPEYTETYDALRTSR